MNQYKWNNEEGTSVYKYPTEKSPAASFGAGTPPWQEYQNYVAGGGLTDPYKTRDEWEQNALALCFGEMDRIINLNLPPNKSQSKDTKLTKALRKESKGNANNKDIKLLDDNDLVDSWLDDMENAAEGSNYGEKWIESPARTEQELIDYDPTLVPWPDFPIL